MLGLKHLRIGIIIRSVMVALLPLLLLAGCAVSFVSPYDALTDQAIQQASVKVETIFSKVTVGKLPHAQTRDDYRELDGQLAVIATRASIHGDKNKAEQEVVRLLQEEMTELEAFHRNVAPYRVSQLAGARSILRSLLHHQKGKKEAVGRGSEGGAQ